MPDIEYYSPDLKSEKDRAKLIAAAVMAIYSSKYLMPHTLGNVPKNMYRDSNKRYSKSSIKCLEFVFLHRLGEK